MAELIGLPYSPWSEKARWALEVRRVPFRWRTYAPLVGELGLRRKLGQWRGPVSVPILIDDGGRAIADSTAIARWADARGEGPRLFPSDEVERWIERSEIGLRAGRARALRRVLDDRVALAEMVPRKIRAALGPAAATVGAFGVRRTLRKYGATAVDAEAHERALVEVLDGLRAKLTGRGGDGAPATLLAGFSVADVAMAQVLAFIEPPAVGLRIAAAGRAAFTDDALRSRYADLVAWRDALYAAHRPR